MMDGQVVEMSNGQQLEMVDGSLIEIRPATIPLDDGDQREGGWEGERVRETEGEREGERRVPPPPLLYIPDLLPPSPSPLPLVLYAGFALVLTPSIHTHQLSLTVDEWHGEP